MTREFVHLHNHTEYSLLDGASLVDQLAKTISDFKMPAVAMTDHGNLFGAVAFYEAMKGQKVKPIIGCEVYVAPGSRFDRKVADQTENAYHFVLLVENEVGYRNLSKLVTAGYTEGFYYKPRIDWELLQRHHEGLIALSGCLQGEIAKTILAQQFDETRRRTKQFQDLFGDRFYLEIQANGLAEQELVNQKKLELAAELGIEVVATNDNHYLHKDDAFAHDCLLCIGTRKLLEDTDRLKFPNNQFYVKTADEMWDTFAHVPHALENTLRIAERCQFDFKFGEVHLPQFSNNGQDLDQLLVETAQQGLLKRFLQLDKQGKSLSNTQQQQYQTRLEYELTVIKKMGYAGYFLIVSDFMGWARQQKIPVGPGRGSAAGSLVSFTTGITDIDPLKHGLLFERFLNPERKSMPDIDVDICMNRRGEVIEYVSQRYGGEDHVAQIAAFGTAKGRQIFKDVGRVMGLSFADTDRITKLMPAPPAEFRLAELYQQDPELRKALASDPKLQEIFDIAKRLEGITRHSSVHAAGVVLSDQPLVEYVPLFKGEHGETVTQFDMQAVEKIGLVKFDFLGLKTLTAMQITVDLVQAYQGDMIDLDNIPEDDPKTFELLQQGQTAGVFQLESEGMRRLLKQLKPETLAEVIAVTALYRPGPMQSGMVDDYVARKHRRKKVEYPLPQLEPILNETYGVIVYQEQVMKIAQVLAGYSLGEADILRKAMGKKIPEIMQQQRTRFVDGCVKNQIAEKAAEDLFDLIVEFAGYGFNKSHSAAYGLIAYRTAYLKAHYPVAFMAALMQCDRDRPQKLITLLREARQLGIEILPPDINQSGMTFTPDGSKIRFGLAAIKNVGEKPVEAILAIRQQQKQFTSLAAFLETLDSSVVNRKTLEGFIRSGALDSFGYPRRTLFDQLDYILDWTAKKTKDRISGQKSLFDDMIDSDSTMQDLQLPSTPEWTASEIAAHERDSIGFYLSAHPLDLHIASAKRFTNTTLAEEQLQQLGDRARLDFIGVITQVKIKNAPRGRRAFLQVEDKEGMVEVQVFGETYQTYHPLLYEGSVVFLSGDLLVDAEQMRRLFAHKIIPIQELEAKMGTMYHISLPLEQLDHEKTQAFSMLLQNYPGQLNVMLHVEDQHRNETLIRLAPIHRVQPSADLQRQLRGLFGDSLYTRVETQ